MKSKGKKFIIGVVLCALGAVGLLGLFTNTDDKAALAAGSVVLLIAGAVLIVLSKKFPDKVKEAGATEQKTESVVFITKTGDKYHIDPSCPGLDNAIRISLDKAKKKGYTACSKCKYSYLNTSNDSE